MSDAVTEFVHLHLHTEYSLVDGILRVDELMPAVAAAAMPAIAVTDQGNLFAMVKCYRAALQQGLKPVIGAELTIADASGPETGRYVLLCQDAHGYRNLSRLVSRSYLEGQHSGTPVINRDWLREASDGLILLSGALQGDVGRAALNGRLDAAAAALQAWQDLFPDRFYLEVMRTGRPGEETYIDAALQLAGEHRCPVVATNDVRFLHDSDFDAHEARVCIQQGRTLNDPQRDRSYSEQQYLRTPAEMSVLFADIPEALVNSVEIAKRCNFKLQLGESYLPSYPVPGNETTEEHLHSQAELGLARRLGQQDEQRQDAYRERLARELDVICQMGFAGYFLIVADFIHWAREHGVPVGPGRGSGAGSLVAYSLEITDLDPLEFDLLFERFLNPERVSLPDFDIDFCMDGRDRVIEYVADKYGRDRVSQIITYGSMAARAVVRDVGRVLGHPYGFADRIAKLIPFEIGMTLDKALEESEELRTLQHDDAEVAALLELAMSLEGLARNAGKHAGGVVIAPAELTEFTPLYCEASGEGVVTQFDKNDVESVGLVKFDFLGLRTLTVIDHAMRTVNRERDERGEAALDISKLPKDDEPTYAMLRTCATTAVFQLESRGMKELIKRLQPDCFDDVVALVALFRPGPLQSGMVDDFVDRKHGRAPIEDLHPDIAAILKPTYGVILYQEQVMQIAQKLAGYTLGGADELRKAMGKKLPAEMAKQREVFLGGAERNRVDGGVASFIFDLMEKFAGYGFNKSHSAAYALLAYQTAWLKTHHKAAFMASVLSADIDTTDKIVGLIEECEALGLRVLGPDVNASDYAFSAVDERSVRYGLGAIKGAGQSAIDSIVEERRQQGPFTDLGDLCRRVDAQRVNRRVLEALVRAGALDSVDDNRARLLAALPGLQRAAEQQHRASDAGQDDLFGEGAATPLIAPALPDATPWDEATRLQAEKETLGLYLTGHPINRYRAELDRFTDGRIADQCARVEPGYGRRGERGSVIAGLVINLRSRNTQGGRMVFVTLDDRSGRIEVVVATELNNRCGDAIVRDTILVVEGDVSVDDFSGGFRVRARELYDLDQARARFAQSMVLTLSAATSANGLLDELDSTLAPYRDGNCRLLVEYQRDDAVARLAFGESWRVRPTEALLARLRKLLGDEQVELRYRA